MSDLIDRQAAIGCLRDGQICGDYCRRAIEQLPPAQPHVYRGVTLNDVMMYFDSLEGNEDAWTEFCSCFECRGWGLYHIRSATEKNVGTNDDCISRQAAIDEIMGQPSELHYPSWYAEQIKELPSAQPERLTDDDFETIRIHLNAHKETLCNQHRWKEAEEYQRIIDRFMGFASAQTETIRCRDCRYGVDYYHDGNCYCAKPGYELLYFDGSWDFYCANAERRT